MTNIISLVSTTFLILFMSRFLASYLFLGLIHFWSLIVTRAYNLAIPIQKFESTYTGIILISIGLFLRCGINFIPLPTTHKTIIEIASIQWFKYSEIPKAIGPINRVKTDINLSMVKKARYVSFPNPAFKHTCEVRIICISSPADLLLPKGIKLCYGSSINLDIALIVCPPSFFLN